jgi:predicted PurR-regulated permease PerM
MRSETARTAAVLGLFAAVAWLLRDALAAIGWSCLIAVSTWPLHQRMQRRLRNQSGSAALLTVAAVLLLLLPVVYLTYYGLREIPTLLRVWATSNDAGLPAPDWLARFPFVGAWAAAQWNAQIGEPGALSDFTHGLAGRFSFRTGRSLVIELGHRAMSIFFCVLVLYFLFARGDALAAQFRKIVVRTFGRPGLHTVRLAVAAVRGTVNGLILVGLGVAAVMSIAYALADVPHPAFWGLITGLLGIVPFGAVVAIAAVALYLLALQMQTTAFALFAFGAVLIFVADHFVRPLFIAGSSRIPLALALLGIVGGLETFGILGLFVGPTLMAIMVAVWRQLASDRVERHVPKRPS